MVSPGSIPKNRKTLDSELMADISVYTKNIQVQKSQASFGPPCTQSTSDVIVEGSSAGKVLTTVACDNELLSELIVCNRCEDQCIFVYDGY